MYKLILLLFFALLLVLDGPPAQGESTGALAAETETLAASGVPRPNYKRYRGNSRHKARRLGIFRRYSLRRKAQRKKRARVTPRRGVISVDSPQGNMPKK